MDDHEFFDERGIYAAEAIETDGEDSREAIDPLDFWREVTDRQIVREVTIDDVEGTGEVTVSKEIWGTLNIVDEAMVQYVKPMHHQGVRYATFIRNDDDSHQGYGENGDQTGDTIRNRCRHGRWTLTAISGLLMESEVLTMSIDSIHVQSASVDVTITDPSALLAVPEDIMLFAVGEEVTVTVSGPPEGSLLFLHFGRNGKSPLQYEGGVFTGTWTVMRHGLHLAGVQALAHDSIFDSEYPDDCLIWAMPYAAGLEDEEE